MKFKNIYIILSLLSLNCKVFSLSTEENKNNTEIIEELLEVEPTSSEEEITLSGDYDFDQEDSLSENEIPDSEECLTPECYETSKRILTSLDFSADPCDDFYQFSCGGWINEQENEDEVDPLVESYYQKLDNTIKILKGEYQAKGNMSKEDQIYDEKTFNKLKNYYNSCVKVDSTDNDYKKETLNKYVSELKIKENTNNYKTVDGMTDLVNLAHDYFSTFLFSFDQDYELYNEPTKEPTLSVTGCKTYEIRSCYRFSDCIEEAKDYIKDQMKEYYYNMDENEIDAIADSFIKIDKQIAESYAEFDDPVDTTIKELNENYPFMDWKKYFTKKFENYNIKFEINDDTPVVNETPMCFENMNAFLQDVDYDALSKYVEYNLYESINSLLRKGKAFLNYSLKRKIYNLEHPFEKNNNEMEKMKLVEQLLKKNEKFHRRNNDKKRNVSDFEKIHKRAYDGEEEPSLEEEISTSFDVDFDDFDDIKLPKNKICLESLNSLMGMALGKYFVENNYSGDFKELAEAIINNIKEAMYNRLPQMEWLDEPTREYAVEKISKIKQKVGYPDYIFDPQKLYKRYEKVEIDSEKYIDNTINLMKYELNYSLLSLYDGSFIEEDGWMPPLTMNAFYSPDENAMIFPAGIFQSPFYYSNAPEYINYGSIGMVIGHELTHAFDSNGKEYDSNGDYNDWWTENDNEEFNDFSQCFIDQYNLYTIQDRKGIEHNIDGEKTLNENLADNGGVSRAYEAWNISMNKNPEKAKKANMALPGLSDFTFDQLFYISYGQSLCVKEKPETTMKYLKDEHSPNNIRVNGVVSNNKHFAKTFNCSNNSRMNPTNKCSIW